MARGGTPAIVTLDAAGVAYRLHEFAAEPTKRGFGHAAAVALGVELERVFKTLIATVDDHNHVVAIVPVSGQLSLKELAAAVHGKRAEMCPPETAERLTGYVVGGISPFGQKRSLPVAIDDTCVLFNTIFVSGGRRGLDIEVAPDELIALLGAVTAPIGSSA